MPRDKRDVLKVLEEELRFIDNKGYDKSNTRPWGVPLIFEDSPTCPNVNDQKHPVACTDCVLSRFVPVRHLSAKVACRHIPLNDVGETVDTLYRWGTLEDAKLVLRNWLTKTIKNLKKKHARFRPDRAAGPSYHLPDAT